MDPRLQEESTESEAVIADVWTIKASEPRFSSYKHTTHKQVNAELVSYKGSDVLLVGIFVVPFQKGRFSDKAIWKVTKLQICCSW